MGDRIGMSNIPRVVAMMHPAQQQAYEDLGQKVSMIQKTAAQEGLNMYFSENMQLAGAPVKVSYMWDKTRIDFVNLDVWGRAEMHPAGFYDVEGRKIFEIRGTSGGIATSQVFYIVASFQLFMTNPAATAYVYNLSIPSGY